MMNAYDFMLLANEAYSATPDFGTKDGAHGIIRQTDNGTAVIFSGTDDLQNLLVDFEFAPSQIVGLGRIHTGFEKYWLDVKLEVLTKLFSSAPKGKAPPPTIFVGHSLGAALAIIAAAHFTISALPVTAIYGFEPPRVSPDHAIAWQLSHVPNFLYQNGNDLVPDLPPYWPQIGALKRIGPPTLPFPNLQDHFCAHVLANLKTICTPGG